MPIEFLVFLAFWVLFFICSGIHAIYKKYERIPIEEEYLTKYFHIMEVKKFLEDEGWVCRKDLCWGIQDPFSMGENWLWYKKNPNFPSPEYIQCKSIKNFFKWLLGGRL